MTIADGDRSSSAARLAARELMSLTQQTETARTVLARLQQEVREASLHLTGAQAAQLIEANEQLVFANLRAQTNADMAAQALRKVPRPAELDALTALPNRILMLDRFKQASVAAAKNRSRFALLFLDLDNFKQINDSLGHGIGDKVLKLAAARLASVVGLSGTVSRYGGDEFLILLDGVADGPEAARVAAKLIAALGVPSRVGGYMLNLDASIGISIYPDDGTEPETLIELADIAMYRAKRHAVSSIAFHGQMLSDEQDQGAANVIPRQQPLTHLGVLKAENARRHRQLQEANEQLVLAALDAQQRQLAAQRAQQRLTELLAVVAHELRNPLAPIRTAAALLGRIRSDEPLLPRVRTILERQVAHMSRLVDDLLDLSRVHTGKFRLLRQDLNLACAIESSVEICQPQIDLRLQHFTLNMPTAIKLEVNGDSVRLTQMLTNLLDNASKYTPEGGFITLDVSASEDSIQLKLADSGIGITPGALSQVFDPFVQDPHAVGFSHLGLGIGLTVVRELVEAHGGTVTAASGGSGCGSQFTVTLPRIHGLETGLDP